MKSQTDPNLTSGVQSALGALPVRWICLSCGHECKRQKVPSYCYQCGMREGYAPVEVPLSATRSDALEELIPGVVVPEWQPLLPIGLPLGCSMVLRGRPGGGKSRAGFRLAGNIGKVMAFALEMGDKLSSHTAVDAGANVSNFWWYNDTNGIDEIEYLDPDVVVVDSVQKLGRSRRKLVDRLMRWARDKNRNLILISQKGQHGASRHGEDDDFDCDCIVDVRSAKHDGALLSEIHGTDDFRTECAPGCTHATVAKSRVCQLLSWDLPIGVNVKARGTEPARRRGKHSEDSGNRPRRPGSSG